MIDNLKKSGELKMYLTMQPKFMSSLGSTKILKVFTIYSKSDSRIVVIGNDRDEIIQEIFDSILQKYQIGLEQL